MRWEPSESGTSGSSTAWLPTVVVYVPSADVGMTPAEHRAPPTSPCDSWRPIGNQVARSVRALDPDEAKKGCSGRCGAGNRDAAASRTGPAYRSPRSTAPALHGATRCFLVLAVALGGCRAPLVIAQAWLHRHGRGRRFPRPSGSRPGVAPLAALLLVVVGRVSLAGRERAAHRSSASAKSTSAGPPVRPWRSSVPLASTGATSGQLGLLLTRASTPSTAISPATSRSCSWPSSSRSRSSRWSPVRTG